MGGEGDKREEIPVREQHEKNFWGSKWEARLGGTLILRSRDLILQVVGSG